MSIFSFRHLLTASVLSTLIFLSVFSIAAAQSCTRANAATVCTGEKVCVVPKDGQQGTCQTPPETLTGPNGQASGETLVNPLKADSLEDLLSLVLKAAVRIGTIILILMFVWVGFLFVAARGSEEKLRTARTAFFWTVIGGLILLGAEGIARVIQSTADTL
ncbi:MAG TPA: pilin [Candidatus Paceibacterota bacterium]